MTKIKFYEMFCGNFTCTFCVRNLILEMQSRFLDSLDLWNGAGIVGFNL